MILLYLILLCYRNLQEIHVFRHGLTLVGRNKSLNLGHFCSLDDGTKISFMIEDKKFFGKRSVYFTLNRSMLPLLGKRSLVH